MAKRLYRYVARAGRLTGRYGQRVELLKCHRGRALVRFADGREDITMVRCLRRVGEESAGQ